MNFDPKILKAAADYYKNFDDDFITKMLYLGWREIGRGDYSIIFSKSDKNYVVKVNSEPDKAFAKFSQLIKKYPNFHFPNISNMEVFASKKGKCYVYLIEKLFKFRSESINRIINRYASFLQMPAQTETKLRKWMLPEDIEYLKSHPALKEAIRIIVKHRGNYSLDLKSDNIMQREDKTVVIIDPYAEFFGVY